jgi:hypothetical protein
LLLPFFRLSLWLLFRGFGRLVLFFLLLLPCVCRGSDSEKQEQTHGVDGSE